MKYPEDSTFTRGRPPEETIAGLEGIDAILAGGEQLTAEVLEGCPSLRVIARCGVGFDKVDIPAATRLGRVVTITPTANHAAVAEQALALLFGVSKRVAIHDKLVRSGGWSTEPMRPIRGQTMGIFGLGRIGRSMAVRCASLGMTVIATEKYPDESFCTEQGIELVDFDTLLSRSDAIHRRSHNRDLCGLRRRRVREFQAGEIYSPWRAGRRRRWSGRRCGAGSR